MEKNHRIAIFLLIIGMLAISANGFAEGTKSEDIKDRMKARLPAVLDLKKRDLVGENNKGFLEYLGKIKERPGVVQAENADRKSVYNIIARQQQSTPEQVGRRRAVQIAKKAKPGEWLQNNKGEWYRKQ